MPNGHSPTKNGGTNGDVSVNNNTPKRSALKNGKEVGKLSPSRTLSFTMRREHEKAKEEAHLIAQLRQVNKSCARPLMFSKMKVQLLSYC